MTGAAEPKPFDASALPTSADATVSRPSGASFLRHMIQHWRALGLAAQFLALAALSLVIFSSAAGVLQNRLLVSYLLETSSDLATAFIEVSLGPVIRAQPDPTVVTPEFKEQLDKIISVASPPLLVDFAKIWALDGTVIYASNPELVGKKFPSDEIERAAKGETVLTYGDDSSAENEFDGHKGEQLAEIYVPVRGDDGKVITIVEFYEDIDKFKQRTLSIVEVSWLIRMASLLLGLTVLYVLVRRAQRTIQEQQAILQQQIEEATLLAAQNEELKSVAHEARRTAVKANEDLLSRTGAEIHDGPIQLLSLAMLTMRDRDGLNDSERKPNRPQSVSMTAEAIAQLRNISVGLILPELGRLSPAQAVQLAVDRHESNTGTQVDAHIGDLPIAMSEGLKACIYRIVQEGLNNAARHAGALGQSVRADLIDGNIVVQVSDSGPGLSMAGDDRPRLGLNGARNRVEAFGGVLTVDSAPGQGLRLIATIPLDADRD